jgi:hypothetical protein
VVQTESVFAARRCRSGGVVGRVADESVSVNISAGRREVRETNLDIVDEPSDNEFAELFPPVA